MKPFYLLLFIALGCQSNPTIRSEEKPGNSENMPGSEMANRVELTHNSLYEITNSESEIGVTDETLFGKFYDDRISFHIVRQPDLLMFGNPVETMTLYFVDQVLWKKKYEFANDISNQLISELGSFKFAAMDWETRDASQVAKIILNLDSVRIINPILSNYRLTWQLEDRTVLYYHEHDSIQKFNYYEEQLPEYKRLLKLIQNN